jgi:hypothetical protein
MSAAFRRTAALLVALAGLVLLAARAVESVDPVGASLSVARKFWRAGTPTRLLNARLLRHDPDFGAALVARDRSWPLAVNVVLVLPRTVPDAAAEEKRRMAAFVLAPRRVALGRGETGPEGFSLVREAP